MNNLKKHSFVIIIVAVVFVVGLGYILTMSKPSKNNVDENKLLTSLGYTEKVVSDIIKNRTTYSADNKRIDEIVESLPLMAYRKYASFSLESSNEINIVYEFDDNYTRGGNGLDTFPDSVRENNALLLFAAVDGLEQVNMLHYENQEISSIDSYTMDDLRARFGDISPYDTNFTELYNLLAENLQLSEFYFAHYSRIYLGATSEDVSYRNMEPNDVWQQENGSTIWLYRGLDGYTATYYFNNLSELYATMFDTNDGESYESLISYLGNPSTVKDMDGRGTYIAYPLREDQQRNAYFIIVDNKVVSEGVMYGTDYEILNYKKTEIGITPSLESQITEHLSDLFTEAYSPYYNGLHYKMSNYEETITPNGDYTATFYWTMYREGTGIDLGKEQEVNFNLQATAKIGSDRYIDFSTLQTLVDTSAVGAPNYTDPVENHFP